MIRALVLTLLLSITFTLVGNSLASSSNIVGLRLTSIDSLPEGEIRVRFLLIPGSTLDIPEETGDERKEKIKTDFITTKSKRTVEFSASKDQYPHIKAEMKYTWNFIAIEFKEKDSSELKTWYLHRFDYMSIIWALQQKVDSGTESTDLMVELPIQLTPAGFPKQIKDVWEEQHGYEN